MILLDISVPILNRTYDFYLDAHKPVEYLIAEIIRLIAEKEDVQPEGETNDFWLCDRQQRVILSRQYTLTEQGVGDGAGLLLV